jgi:hypothetical protein
MTRAMSCRLLGSRLLGAVQVDLDGLVTSRATAAMDGPDRYRPAGTSW